ncbi:MAG: RsmB/NOP family class I SAM-dependent RNA methyltransferase [Shimia sp.]
MTPAARNAAAIEVIDAILGGVATEKALLSWSRRSRFAGSKDRAAVRDIVFAAARRRASAAAMGGEMSGRGIVRGLMAQEGIPDGAVFGAGGHAPPAWPDAPPRRAYASLDRADRLDMQPWVLSILDDSFGRQATDIAMELRERAPVWLRVNAARATPGDVIAHLAADGIEAMPDARAPHALRIIGTPRGLVTHPALADGLAEFQDLSAQMACDALGDVAGLRVLDFCAGGGGKALALAARGARVTAHDADPARMNDLIPRARRAGAAIEIATDIRTLPRTFDLVVCDVPCSGSGAWRRSVESKWRLTPDALTSLRGVQDEIVGRARHFLAPGGRLVHMTCSLLPIETQLEIDGLLAEHEATVLNPLNASDGFSWRIHV